MKKYLKLSLIYAIAAMVGGVFYREFTKFSGFTGVTALGKVHPHLLLLGTVMFLLVALFSRVLAQEEQKSFRVFLPLYQIGLVITTIMMLVRGVVEVGGSTISSGMSAAISGVSGLGHICLGVGLVLLLVSWIRSAPEKN